MRMHTDLPSSRLISRDDQSLLSSDMDARRVSHVYDCRLGSGALIQQLLENMLSKAGTYDEDLAAPGAAEKLIFLYSAHGKCSSDWSSLI